jgi:hypothetical protein
VLMTMSCWLAAAVRVAEPSRLVNRMGVTLCSARTLALSSPRARTETPRSWIDLASEFLSVLSIDPPLLPLG